MAQLPYCPTIGFIYDLDCVIDADLEWQHGEPVMVVNDVMIGGHSLLTHDDKLMTDLGHRIVLMAEDDERLIEKLVEDECTWTGRGSNDPAGRFVERV